MQGSKCATRLFQLFCSFIVGASFLQTKNAPAPVAPPIILSVTEVIHGMSTKRSLFVRLTSDGNLEGEDWGGDRGPSRHSVTLPSEELATIVKRLDALDVARLRPTMGPYNTYTDTSAELQIQILVRGEGKQYLLWNPWLCTLPSCSMGKKKQMPRAVKTLFCEISLLRSRISREPLPPGCPTNP